MGPHNRLAAVATTDCPPRRTCSFGRTSCRLVEPGQYPDLADGNDEMTDLHAHHWSKSAPSARHPAALLSMLPRMVGRCRDATLTSQLCCGSLCKRTLYLAAAQFVRPVPVFAEEALAPLADATPKDTTWHPSSKGMMLPAGPFFTKGNQIVDWSGNPVRIASLASISTAAAAA